jgi:NADH-quinone oxidoreductase subunit F
MVNRGGCIDLAKGEGSRTTNPKVHAGGDAVTGPDTVIGAIAAGHRAAREIDGAIRSQNREPAYEEPAEEMLVIPLVIDEETLESKQTMISELHGVERKQGFLEVEMGFTMEEALTEAARCLRCDAEIAG